MKYQGKNLQIMDEEGNVPFALSKSCTLEVKSSYLETAGATQADWREYVYQCTEWSVSVNGLAFVGSGAMAMAVASKEPVSIRFCMGDTDSGELFAGEVFLENVKYTGTVKEVAVYSAKLRGTGELRKVR